MKVILDARIDATYKQKMKNLTDDHIITKKDVEDLIKKLEELPLGKFHRIIDERNDRENS